MSKHIHVLRILAALVWLLLPVRALAQSQSIVLNAPPPPVVTSVTAQITASGLGTYCEWVVAIYPIGKSAPSAPACVSNAGGSVGVSWSPGGVGVTGYDVLRTTGPSLPSGSSLLAVATNVACCSQTDNLGALASYTLTSASPAQATLRLNNQTTGQPRIAWDTPYDSLAGYSVTSLGPIITQTSVIDATRGLVTAVPAIVANAGIVTRGLSAMYLVNEKAGAVVLDYSGNGNHGTVVGTPSWQPTGISFPSITQFISVPDAAWTTMKSAVWVATSPGVGNEYLIGPSGASSSQRKIALQGGLIRVNGAGGAMVTTQAAKTAGLRTSTYVSNAVLDKIYTDAYETAYALQGPTGAIALGTGATIGLWNGAGFSGTLSFFALYSVELTPAEVAQNSTAIKKLLVGRGTTTVPVECSGDSLTSGFAADSGFDYPTLMVASLGTGFTVSNLGHTGYTTDQLRPVAQLAIDADGKYSIFNPRHVAVLEIGTNDVFNPSGSSPQTGGGGWLSQAQILANLNQLCLDRKAAGYDYCLVSTIIARGNTDIGTAPALVNRLQLNAAIRSATGMAWDAVIDLAADPVFATTTATLNFPLIYNTNGDRVHLSDYGYGIMAQIVRRALLPFLVF